MTTQNYANHRYNPGLSAAGFFMVVIAAIAFAVRGYGIGGHVSMGIGLCGVIGALIALLAISREYTTRLQDRIIKLEMRLRAAAVLPPDQQAALFRLQKAQIVALRFASDAELPALIERAEREQLSSNQIKQAITNWVPDWDRT